MPLLELPIFTTVMHLLQNQGKNTTKTISHFGRKKDARESCSLEIGQHLHLCLPRRLRMLDLCGCLSLPTGPAPAQPPHPLVLSLTSYEHKPQGALSVVSPSRRGSHSHPVATRNPGRNWAAPPDVSWETASSPEKGHLET